MHTCTHTYIHVYTCTHMRVHDVHTSTYMHTHVHTHTHTHTPMHTHSVIIKVKCLPRSPLLWAIARFSFYDYQGIVRMNSEWFFRMAEYLALLTFIHNYPSVIVSRSGKDSTVILDRRNGLAVNTK